MPTYMKPAGKSKAQCWYGVYEKFGTTVNLTTSAKGKDISIFPLSRLGIHGSEGGPFMATMGKAKSSIFFGTKTFFQLAVSGFTESKGKGPSQWHLGRMKVPIVKKNYQFNAVYPGTTCEPGEFRFIHPNGYLELTNITGATGIWEDSYDGGGYDITTKHIDPPQIIITNIIQKPIEIN